MAAPEPTTQLPWATVDDVCQPCVVSDPEAEPPVEGNVDAATLESALRVATDVVWALSGRQFSGLTTATLRPCQDPRHRYRTTDPGLSTVAQLGSTLPLSAYGYAARWVTGCHHRAVERCGCAQLHAIDLGVRPLVSVERVQLGTEVLDPTAYRIDDWRELVRLDGEPWPDCQDLTADDGDAGSFVVDVTYGKAPPEAGVRAVAALGCQLALSCNPDTASECSLPKRVTSITRQGLTMAVMDPFDFLDAGKTGVYEVDLFVKAYNPHGITRAASVRSPDLPRRARRVGT